MYNLYNLNLSLKRQKTLHKGHSKTVIFKNVKGMRVMKRLKNYSKLKELGDMKHNSELDHFGKKKIFETIGETGMGPEDKMRVIFLCWLPGFHSGIVVTE